MIVCARAAGDTPFTDEQDRVLTELARPVALALQAGRLADRHGYHKPMRVAVTLTLIVCEPFVSPVVFHGQSIVVALVRITSCPTPSTEIANRLLAPLVPAAAMRTLV